PIFDGDGAGSIHQAVAVVQADNGRERAGAFGAVNGRLEGEVAVVEFDRFGAARDCSRPGKQQRHHDGRSARSKAEPHGRVPVLPITLYNTNARGESYELVRTRSADVQTFIVGGRSEFCAIGTR